MNCGKLPDINIIVAVNKQGYQPLPVMGKKITYNKNQ